MRHELIDRTITPIQLAAERRFVALELRVNVMERRGDRFDGVIGTVRLIGMGLGILITAFGGAILFKLGAI